MCPHNGIFPLHRQFFFTLLWYIKSFNLNLLEVFSLTCYYVRKEQERKGHQHNLLYVCWGFFQLLNMCHLSLHLCADEYKKCLYAVMRTKLICNWQLQRVSCGWHVVGTVRFLRMYSTWSLWLCRCMSFIPSTGFYFRTVEDVRQCPFFDCLLLSRDQLADVLQEDIPYTCLLSYFCGFMFVGIDGYCCPST